jgi:hypothetical protein
VYFKKILLYGTETWSCTKREESKLQAAEMKFLRGIVEKPGEVELETHTLGESSGWRKYRTKSRGVD